MIDFSVVVLPAPLRPSSVTTSPTKTSKLAPWSTWDSPYQAWSPSTASSGGRLGRSMADPEIGLAHQRVGRNRLVVAFGEHSATREHRDAIGKVGDHAEVVLDHQHRASGSDRLDERADAIDIFVTHAGHRFVEQEHFRVERQCGCDLQGTLATVWQFNRRPTGEGRQADIGDERHGAVVEDAGALLGGHSVTMPGACSAKSGSRLCDAIVLDVPRAG